MKKERGNDVTNQKRNREVIKRSGSLQSVVMDEYDRLIQLYDSIAGVEGVLDMEERMGYVKRRYGGYPIEKWNMNLAIKKHFEDKMGKDLYAVVRKN